MYPEDILIASNPRFCNMATSLPGNLKPTPILYDMNSAKTGFHAANFSLMNSTMSSYESPPCGYMMENFWKRTILVGCAALIIVLMIFVLKYINGKTKGYTDC